MCLSLCLTLFPWLQYSYDGMEMSSLPVDLMVIWNGDFSIDNPAQNKGEVSDPAALLVPWIQSPWLQTCSIHPLTSWWS